MTIEHTNIMIGTLLVVTGAMIIVIQWQCSKYIKENYSVTEMDANGVIHSVPIKNHIRHAYGYYDETGLNKK